MSNIGSTSIYIPKNIRCEIKQFDQEKWLWISGNFGLWTFKTPNKIDITLKNNMIVLSVPKTIKKTAAFLPSESKKLNSIWSLLAVRIQKMLHGASVGFKSYLRVRGVGYKFVVEGQKLQVHVGLSHLLNWNLHPEFLVKTTRKQKMLRFRSQSLVSLSNTVAALRNLKKPNVYTGKGIRYRQETTIKKEGKQRKTF